MKIAIQGIKQSFHAIAARTLFSKNIELVDCDNFRDVFISVKNGDSDYGVVAIENSLYGSINDTYDLLVKHDLSIIGETYEQIGLHLLGLPNSKLEDITDVYSHPAALGESANFLDTQIPNARRHEFSDTALAAKYISDTSETSKAAIAGRAAGEEYKLKFLKNNIESHKHNYTRFIAIGREPVSSLATNKKSSIVFQTADKPGSLYSALGVFAKLNINMTKLESRPIIGSAWRYMYYLDIEGSFDADIKNELSRHATNIRILGCYEKGLIKKT